MKPLAQAIDLDERVTRGPQPESHYDVKWLKERGFKSILNLQVHDSTDELKWCEHYGIKLLNMDLSGIWPDYYDVHYAVRLLHDPTLSRIYVHCRHGRERTGIVCALYRLIQQGWCPDTAYAELLALGCRWPWSWQFQWRFL